jgi:CBS domain-containing protein
MTRTVVRVAKDTPVMEAIKLFASHTFRHMPVTDGTTVVGILSDRDITRFAARGESPRATLVESIMTERPTVARPDLSLVDAVRLIVFHRINCLPVVDEAHNLLGIVTTTDLLAALHDLMDGESRLPGALAASG